MNTHILNTADIDNMRKYVTFNIQNNAHICCYNRIVLYLSHTFTTFTVLQQLTAVKEYRRRNKYRATFIRKIDSSVYDDMYMICVRFPVAHLNISLIVLYDKFLHFCCWILYESDFIFLISYCTFIQTHRIPVSAKVKSLQLVD